MLELRFSFSGNKDPVDREEEDNLLLERILLLIRNLLYVPADPDNEKVQTSQTAYLVYFNFE